LAVLPLANPRQFLTVAFLGLGDGEVPLEGGGEGQRDPGGEVAIDKDVVLKARGEGFRVALGVEGAGD